MSLALVRRHYQLTLPSEIRKILHCQIGDVIEMVVKGKEVVLRPKTLVDKDQAWFWSKEWQEAEREAQEDVKKGRIKKFNKAEDLIRDLKK